MQSMNSRWCVCVCFARRLHHLFGPGHLQISRAKANYASDKIKDGVFGAYMHVDLSNDGPVTIWLDSQNRDDKKASKSS